MDRTEKIKLNTITPVRSPIATESESRAADEAGGVHDEVDGLPCVLKSLSDRGVLEFFEWPWHKGYGTLSHDNIPKYFLPIACYRININNKKIISNIEGSTGISKEDVNCCNVYLYDDTVALLQVDFVFNVEDEQAIERLRRPCFDQSVSDFSRILYNDFIYPEFQYLEDFFTNSKKNFCSFPPIKLKNPENFSIFRDVTFSKGSAPRPYVLWTGRCMVVHRNLMNSELGDVLCDWVSFSGSKEDLLSCGHAIGSGSILVVANDLDAKQDDWLRGLLVCQFYNAFLSVYGGILKSNYSLINDYFGKSVMKKKDLSILMKKITKSLDHLEFSRLEFKDMVVGVQAGRELVVGQVCDKWKIYSVLDGVIERAGLIRSRIDRLILAQSNKVNRSVEAILFGIGGVAVVDLCLSLIIASKELGKDRFPGLLDAVSIMDPDGSLLISSGFLLLMAIYIYRAKI